MVDPRTTGAATEPASFRDPASTVFYLNGRVLRGLSKQGPADYEGRPTDEAQEQEEGEVDVPPEGSEPQDQREDES